MPRKHLAIGLASLLFVGILAAIGMSWAIREPSGCDSMPTSADGQAKSITLVVELEGNTVDDAKNVETFVREQLEGLTQDPSSQFAVRVSFVKNGEKYALTGCLSQSRYIIPPKEDLETYENDNSSADTKRQLEASMTRYRQARIGWIADEASDRVRQVSFEGVDPSKAKLSPIFAWNAAVGFDQPGGTIAILSPFTSTVDDCFRPSGSSSAQDQVQDCIEFQQVVQLKSAVTSLVLEPSLLDASTRDRAEATRSALCKFATEDGCSATGKS